MMIILIRRIITIIFVFINLGKSEHEDEEDCECGIVGGNPNQFPWYVALRITVEVPRKSPRARPDKTTYFLLSTIAYLDFTTLMLSHPSLAAYSKAGFDSGREE